MSQRKSCPENGPNSERCQEKAKQLENVHLRGGTQQPTPSSSILHKSWHGRAHSTQFLRILSPTHLLLGCRRLCRYIKFTSNLLMSLHLKGEEPRVNGEWPQSPCGPTAPNAERASPPHTPHSPLLAGREFPSLTLLQLVVHFGCLVKQPLEVPIGPLK